MKIIDEKGRLFGKLNLIDLLVIILLIAAVAAVAWKLVGKKAAETVADTGRTITYTVTVEDVNREAAEFASTQIGKSLVNNSKVVDAAITDAAVTDRADSAHVDLGVTIEGRGQFTGNVYKVGAPGSARRVRIHRQDQRIRADGHHHRDDRCGVTP